jgi:hypothetical protein
MYVFCREQQLPPDMFINIMTMFRLHPDKICSRPVFFRTGANKNRTGANFNPFLQREEV